MHRLTPCDRDLEYHRPRASRWEAGPTTVQGKLHLVTDSGEYREGTVKSTPARGVKECLKPHASMQSKHKLLLRRRGVMACLLEYDPTSRCVSPPKAVSSRRPSEREREQRALV